MCFWGRLRCMRALSNSLFIGWFLGIRDSQHVGLVKLARIGVFDKCIAYEWFCLYIAQCPNTHLVWLVHPSASISNCPPRNALSVASERKMQSRFVKKRRRKPKKHRSPQHIQIKSWTGLRWVQEIIPKCVDFWLSFDRTHVG